MTKFDLNFLFIYKCLIFFFFYFFFALGKVYNLTPYLEFHPGGIDELMRGAGKDSTQLFDEVSALQ